MQDKSDSKVKFYSKSKMVRLSSALLSLLLIVVIAALVTTGLYKHEQNRIATLDA